MAKQSKHVRKPAKKAKHKKVASQGAHGTGTITDRDLKRAERSLSKSRGLQTSKYNTLHLSLPVKIILIIFVVIISISMMVPSLASVVAGNRKQEEQKQQRQRQSEDTDAADASEGEIDQRYQALVGEQQQKVGEDSSNLAALLNVGNTYMRWGHALMTSDQASGDADHIHDIFNKAVAAYDQYLSQNDSDAVRVNRAYSQYYGGDTQGAIDSLVTLTQNDANFGPAWLALGTLYQGQGDIDDAKNAYNQAIAVEPNDEYGSKSAAQSALQAIAQRESAAQSKQHAQGGGDSSQSTPSGDSSGGSLQGDLSDATGTGE